MLVVLVAFALGGSPSTNLAITVWPKGPAHGSTIWRLRCAPAGGTLPGRAAACRRLNAFPDNPFAPTPPGTICTEIYGGPQEALVARSFRGRRVWTRFTRRDGCAINRWSRVSFLFPARL